MTIYQMEIVLNIYIEKLIKQLIFFFYVKEIYLLSSNTER